MNNSTYIVNPNGERDPKGCVHGFFIILAAVIITVVLCFCFSSCASTKSLEKIETTENNTTNVIDETTSVEQTETSHHEEHSTATTETGTEITFGAGGGTYNSKTGEATNVAGVKESAKSHEQSDKVADLTSRIDILQHTNDSLSSQVNTYQHELDEEKTMPKRSGWDRFCTKWFLATAFLLLIKVAVWVMEKYPATAAWIGIIRRFVPFL